ncbi:SMI1/KNR4 family protein [Streptomyces sp. H39-S7]|uniref:SMI1/KNR4 family protein n=1 Tax=Streptomyces sp. H39-S7 TaxID=3004357 RepID=UPI0022AF242E|nr:SMI1/KNR4 family protein [Streptomyces sp. H39-S7]MCZ4123530.1 SMI1/KNR4 family protein [Streptomyces sp. H39-S7]
MTGIDGHHDSGADGMGALSDIVARVRERALQEGGELPDRVGEREVAAAERELGFPLPRLLVRLYQEVANGGFGPEYLLLPLVGEGRTVVAEYGPCEYWPHGLLPILDWGCGMYAAVDCLDPRAPVLLFEPNAGPQDWAEAWFTDSPSLAQWLSSWLDGTGWWEEEVMMAEDAPEPQHWPDATRRLAS